MGPDGKEGKDAVEERQGGEGERPAPGSSLSRYTCDINSETIVQVHLRFNSETIVQVHLDNQCHCLEVRVEKRNNGIISYVYCFFVGL